MAYDNDNFLTPEQRRLYAELTGKPARRPVVDPYYGTVRINVDTISSQKVRNLVATKKYVGTLVIEANILDKFDQGTKVNLVQIQLTSDDLTDLLAKAHGHLELVSDK